MCLIAPIVSSTSIILASIKSKMVVFWYQLSWKMSVRRDEYDYCISIQYYASKGTDAT